MTFIFTTLLLVLFSFFIVFYLPTFLLKIPDLFLNHLVKTAKYEYFKKLLSEIQEKEKKN